MIRQRLLTLIGNFIEAKLGSNIRVGPASLVTLSVELALNMIVRYLLGENQWP